MDIKNLIKQTILYGVETFGLNAFYRKKTRRKLLCLCYHGVISDDAPAGDARTNIAVTVSQFEEQLKELRKHWNPVALETIHSGSPLPDNAVFVSFDDGWRNNLTLAAPLLKKYKIQATVFLTTDYIGTVNSLFWALEMLELLDSSSEESTVLSGVTHPLPIQDSAGRTAAAIEIVEKAKRVSQQDRETLLQELRSKVKLDLSEPWKKELYEFLSWDDVHKLKKNGWSIGCHTKSHPILSALKTAQLESELGESKAKIEAELGEPCETLAYPNGSAEDYNEETIAVAKQLGFRTAFTLENKRSEPPLDPFCIHRICITRDLTLNSFRAIISGMRGM